MSYFNKFNRVTYNIEDNTYTAQVVTNILQRSAFLKEIVQNTAIAYEYLVKDSDTPEIIAHKLYKSPTRHWIVLLFNKIINPYYDWPMNTTVFEKYIENKYGYSVDVAQNTLHHYEKRVQRYTYQYGQIQHQTIDKYEMPAYNVNLATGEISEWSALPTITNPLQLFDEDINETFADGTSTVGITTLHYVSVYDYEYDINDSRRTIKLLDASYIPAVEDEFRRLMRDV